MNEFAPPNESRSAAKAEIKCERAALANYDGPYRERRPFASDRSAFVSSNAGLDDAHASSLIVGAHFAFAGGGAGSASVEWYMA